MKLEMNLPTLLTQITPLETDSEQPLTKAYVKHAATHFPELVKALEDSIGALSEYIPKQAKGHAEGCFKYVIGGYDMWNCACPICNARAILARANEIKV